MPSRSQIGQMVLRVSTLFFFFYISINIPWGKARYDPPPAGFFRGRGPRLHQKLPPHPQGGQFRGSMHRAPPPEVALPAEIVSRRETPNTHRERQSRREAHSVPIHPVSTYRNWQDLSRIYPSTPSHTSDGTERDLSIIPSS